MEEPATIKDAENAGAKYTDAKIMFIVKRSEIMQDPGTDQPKARMFINSGDISITERCPIILEN